MNVHKQLKELAKEMERIGDAIESAPRIGAPTDEPEGTRYVQISDTLAHEMEYAIARAESYLNQAAGLLK